MAFSRTVTLRTGLSPEAALAGLSTQVRKGAVFAIDVPRDGVPLRGQIAADRFEVVRRTQVRNSFTPIARGRIAAVEGGSEVTVTCSMHVVPMVALACWVIVGFGLVALIATDETVPMGLEVVALLALPLAGPLLGFALWRAELDALLADITIGITRRDA
ncbi:MAG: hypothetical protein SFW67_27435 [Myxococcaceae bacterium]|nr:hypothetical protein [Myxococcaceae bacterium]